MAEIEESTRKLVNLKMQKDRASGMHVPASVATNGTVSPEKPADRVKRIRIMKDSIQETKVCIVYLFSHTQTGVLVDSRM